MSKLDEKQIAQLIRWREAGRSYRAIADRLGISPGGVLYHCLKHGAISPHQTGRQSPDAGTGFAADRRGGRRFTPEEDAQLLALEAEGLGYLAISRRMGRPYSSCRIRCMLLAQHDEIALSR